MRHRLTRLGLALSVVAFVPAVGASTKVFAAGPISTTQSVAHHPGAVLAEGVTGPALELLGTGFNNAAEPTIGITRDGTVFADVMTKIVSSRDQGRTWKDVTPANRPVTLDPYLYVDPVTSRVFKSDLLGTCQQFSYSDDAGSTWTTVPAGCNLSDHQTIAAGPPVVSETIGYPNVLYNCSQSLGYNGYSTASVCDKSLDGGATWIPTGTPAFNDPSPYGVGPGSGDGGFPVHCNGDIGHVFVGNDGTLFVPRGWCGQPWVAISRDEGLTWTRSQVATNGMNTTLSGGFGLVAPGSGQSDHEAAVVADAKGNLFFLWMALDRLPYLAVSRDRGATWSAPMMVGAPGVNEAWGPALGIDPAGRVSVAYMGTSNSPGAPWTGSYAQATWTGYVSILPSPTDPKPVIFSAAASLPNRPLVRGACGPNRCDPVLDFIDVQSGPDGSAWGSFVDATKSKQLVVAHMFPPQ